MLAKKSLDAVSVIKDGREVRTVKTLWTGNDCCCFGKQFGNK